MAWIVLVSLLVSAVLVPEAYGDGVMITSFDSDPPTVEDTANTAETIDLNCEVNLPSANITSVILTHPDGTTTSMTPNTDMSNLMLYQTVINDVHPSHSGIYVCTVVDTSVPQISVTKNYDLTISCSDGYYDPTCSSQCSCVSVATCNSTTGVCTNCPVTAGIACNKAQIAVTSFGSVPPVNDVTDAVQDVTFQCTVNLPTADITSVVITGPNGYNTPIAMPATSGLYEAILRDVGPPNSGMYTCMASTDVSSHSKDYMLSVNCRQGYYGVGCKSRCNCVSGGNPSCDDTDGICTCDETFPGATCDKDLFNITSFQPLSGDVVVLDDNILNNVSMRCGVNLAESEIAKVTIIFPTAATRDMTRVTSLPGVWEYTLINVHPRNSGQYSCSATTKRVLDFEKDVSRKYTLTVTDVDECQENTHNCHENATCRNEAQEGGFHCDCNSGFEPNGFQCNDINECERMIDNCHDDATCMNTIGSFYCVCNNGFSGNGIMCQMCTPLVNYGFNCMEDCTCVANMPGQNDVACDKEDGTCTCDTSEFSGKECNKDDLNPVLTTYPDQVRDQSGQDNVTWRCDIKLHSRDLSGNVTIAYPNGSKYPMTMNGEGLYELVLNDVTPNNNGWYRCEATANGMMPQSGEFYLDVLIVGRIISVSPPVEGQVGTTVEVNCTVYARQGANITWFSVSDEDTPIENDDKYNIMRSGEEFEQTSTLRVSNLDPNTDNGTYICNATKDRKEVEIIVIEAPIIKGITVTTKSKQELQVSWAIDFNGNVPLYECMVNYSDTQIGQGVQAPGSLNNAVSHVIMGLNPYTWYYVNVQCKNKVGVSNVLPGGPQRTNQSEPSRPLRPAERNIQKNSFEVIWEEPDMKNGPISFYTVTIFLDGNEIKKENTPSSSRSISKDSLLPYTEYTVEITASNEEFGDELRGPASSIIITTLQDAPPPPPTPQEGKPPNSDEEAITSSTFYMTLMQASSRNGNISCYDIIVKELAEGENIDDLDPDDYPPGKIVSYGEAYNDPGKPYLAVVIAGPAVDTEQNVKIGDDKLTKCGVISGGRKRRAATYEHIANNGRLRSSTRYTTFVRAFVNVGDGEVYTSSLFMKPVTTGKGTNTTAIIIGVFLAILCIIVVILIGLIFMRRRKQTLLLREGENGVALESLNAEESGEVTHMVVPPIPLEDLPAMVKVKSENDDEIVKTEYKISYENDINVVDEALPTYYERVGGDPLASHQNDAAEVSPTYEDIGVPSWAQAWSIAWDKMINGEKVLGKGNFGEVIEGAVVVKGEVTKAAIKKLKADASPIDRQNFMEEFRTLTKIGRHPNIVGLLGACQHQDNLYVALEYLPNGDLRSYLRTARCAEDESQADLCSSKLIQFALDIAKGMQHLAALGLIHRDLAARNILLDNNLVAQVSDFGLSRGEDIYVQTSKTRVPTRWLSIESIARRVYTSKSDVWSFGILLWEIASLGATPYEGIETRNLLCRLENGYRMPKPSNCEQEIYDLMLECWQEEPKDRPSFKKLATTLQALANQKESSYMWVLPKSENNMYMNVRPELDDN